MTNEEFLESVTLLVVAQNVSPPAIEFRAYYNADGSIITYTTENLSGDYIVITAQQYSEARPDAKVFDGQLVHTHRRSHVSKLLKNKSEGVKTNKYDISVIADEYDDDTVYYTIKAYEIKR